MLKINLLPPYIYEKSKRVKVAGLWAVIVVLVVAGFLYWQKTINDSTNNVVADTNSKTANADAADKAASDATAENAKNQDVLAKATFVRGAQKHDTEVYPALVSDVTNYTWNRVKYDTFVPNQDTVAISAYTPLLRDIGQYMLAMERNPAVSRVDITTNDMQSFPAGGYGIGQSADYRPGSGHQFQVALHLASPVTPGPTYGAAPAANGGFGGGGPLGGMGGGMGGGGLVSGGGASTSMGMNRAMSTGAGAK